MQRSKRRERELGRTNKRQNSICQFVRLENGAIVGPIERRARGLLRSGGNGEKKGVTQLTFKISGRSPRNQYFKTFVPAYVYASLPPRFVRDPLRDLEISCMRRTSIRIGCLDRVSKVKRDRHL